MQTNPENSQALNSLQSEINLILEHTGRFFASIGRPAEQAARASRLKQQVATSGNRYHEAFDVLDEQLQVAKAVMRRDLVVAREKEGKQPETKIAESAVIGVSKANNETTSRAEEKSTTTQVAAQPAEPQTVQTPISPEATPVKSPRKRSSTAGEEGSSDERAAKRQALGNEKSGSPKRQAEEPQLQIDIGAPAPEPTESQPAEDMAPDTETFSNNADLDSLFNDAGGAGGTDSGPGTDFNTDDNANNEFDFSTFNASLENNDGGNADDNADVSTLLPGLQDYANDTENAEADLSSFFMNDPPNPINGQGQVPEPGRDDGGIFEDPIFGEFMDIGGDMTFDMGGGNDDANTNFDFNFDE